MKSSWDTTKATSSYHFDPMQQDRKHDVLIQIGYLKNTWAADLSTIIENSKPANWETRAIGRPGKSYNQPELAAEEYDLERVGADPKMVITNLNWEIPDSLKHIGEMFGMDDCMERVHVQWPGQVWNLHLDKLQKWCPEDPSKVVRIFVQLTDWAPGQFWEYGNYHWHQWRAGDVTTFDWTSIPHSTANAGHHPRVTLQLTGVITDKTRAAIERLKVDSK